MTRKTWALAGAAVLVVVAAAVGVAATSGRQANVAAPQPAPVQTAQVQQRSLTAIVSQPGTLTYRAQADGSPYSVIDQARGAYTKLPAAGQVIAQGHALYRADNSPVVLLYGSTPVYRTLSAGTSGPDVAELNADLVALGYATPAQLNPRSASFGSATTTAVARLEAALGVTENGMLSLGQAVFEPGPVRVTAVSAQLGGTAHPGEAVLQGTSTAREVQVALDVSQQTDVAVGDKVSITLPNNQTTAGVVSSVGAVASCPPASSGGSGSGSGSAPPATDTCSAGGSGSIATPTVTVGVTPSDPAVTRTWDQAAVQVGITTARVPHALVVPVTALLARSDGGYGVEVIGAGARSHLVAVSLGLFDDADGLVQVTGSALAAGQEVAVAST